MTSHRHKDGHEHWDGGAIRRFGAEIVGAAISLYDTNEGWHHTMTVMDAGCGRVRTRDRKGVRRVGGSVAAFLAAFHASEDEK